ncbi:helix-turn-helix transcriptional regulator, partial [Streptomyces sp. SID3343]|nr:helix-turn-helix transcriptional regulator [Streptomyces sp. SID3343]
VVAARPGPAEQVAALLAVVDAGGQALEELDHVLSRAHGAAGGDPGLQARVELRQAIRANICGAGPYVARDASARAAILAREAGDRPLEAMALTMRARVERVIGDPGSAESLAEALALAVSVEEIGVAESPQYLAVRFALFDDRLQEARERLLELLPFAERSGVSEDLIEVLRSLTEVAVRAGDAAKAVTWSERALALCAAAGLSPGPVRWTAAVAQLAGGRFETAIRHAERGLHASRDAHDTIFTSRNLLVLASTHLATGDNVTALAALRSVAEIEADQGIADLTMLRWEPELAEALAGTGELDEADELLDRLCAAADASVLAGGVGAAITRARALCAAR